MHKPAVTDAPLIDAINDRWSALAYDPDREIAPADLRTLLEAARWAPSASSSWKKFRTWPGSAAASSNAASGCARSATSSI